MRRLLIYLCAAIFLAVLPSCALRIFKRPFTNTYSGLYALADDSESAIYAVPNGRECYFCETKNLSSALFCVPYTYCVEVLDDDGEWLRVSYGENSGEYKKVYGYCKSDEFTVLDEKPQTTYLIHIVTVTYSAGESDSPLTPPTDMQASAAYYGFYRYGATYYSYVYCRGSFCYIEGANDDYPLNDLPTDDDTDEHTDGDAGTDESEESVTVPLIIFIVILAAALIAVCALAFSPKKNREE